MKRTLFMFLAVIFTLTISAQQNPREGFQEYSLANGMKVYLWVDKDMSDVYGQVTVRAGSIDEPEDFTGLAHYLEHELFKGTQTIGALDWAKEKPLYDEIIRLYDECAAAGKAGDNAKKDELIKKINELSIEAGKISQDDDFPRVIQSIGGYNLNAYTSFDVTAYHNSFPSYQMEKWLTVYYDRLVNPVFRSFQAELENVFEEYNLRMPNVGAQQQTVLFENAFKGTPYARDVIGSVEHLKNPSMNPMIKFYNDWYVPNNMALVLVGNFDAEAAKPLIEKTFGKFEAKPLPERVSVNPQNFAGNPTVKVKLGYEPSLCWVFEGVKEGHPDKLKLEFALMCLNNGQETGFFDKLNLEQTVGYASAWQFSQRGMGRIFIEAAPHADINTRTYDSDKQTEKSVFGEINKLKKGNIPSWLFQSVKEQYLQQLKYMAEYSGYKINVLNDVFLYEQSIEDYFNLEEKIKALTIDDIKEVATKYFDSDYLTISFTEGEPKIQKLAKPKINPLTTRPDGEVTEYAKNFKTLPEGTMQIEYSDFSDVQYQNLDEGKGLVDLYYSPNPKNDLFSLYLEYGVGTHQVPELEYAARLMNYSGAMPNSSAQDIKRELSRYGATVTYAAGYNRFYIVVEGEEKNLEKILQTVTRQSLMPKLDNNAIEQVMYSTVVRRLFYEQKIPAYLSDALWQYVQYGQESSYIDRIPSKSLLKIGAAGEDGEATYSPLLTNIKLTTTIQDATSYGVKMYYTGAKPIDEVAKILKGNTPIKADMKPREQEYFRKRVEYNQPQIYFLPNSDIQQASVYMYIPIGKDYSKDKMINEYAFNEYFNGGFAGLVLIEIREKRSLAYGAGGNSTGSLRTKDQYFVGQVGTQNDKVLEVVDTYVDLLKNMPVFSNRISEIKPQLKAQILAGKYSFRNKAMSLESLKEVGFTDDPAKYLLPQVDNLTFDDITNFYNTNIKNKPTIIVIHGDPKLVNIKEIQKKYGKVTNLTKAKLFKGGNF
ncbi:MAG: insulinase family protein [Prevotellaceae bacterium]|jgi:predicted Zn-dependent peptidase|nr:insulinase family protein [Prevotellaceae bacterium]